MNKLKSATATIKMYTPRGVDLGTLQDGAEKTAKALKAANAALVKAKKAAEDAEAAYNVAQKALAAGVEQLRASTKVV